MLDLLCTPFNFTFIKLLQPRIGQGLGELGLEARASSRFGLYLLLTQGQVQGPFHKGFTKRQNFGALCKPRTPPWQLSVSHGGMT